MASLINHLSSVPQFNTSLHEASKVTVIHAQLGEVAFGTSPGKATVMATLRSHEQSTMDHIKTTCQKTAMQIASAHNLECTIEWVEEFPSTVNDADLVRVVEGVAKKLKMQTVWPEQPFPWSEDFGHFAQKNPAILIGLGAGMKQPPLHHPTYDFPDSLLPLGVELLDCIVRDILARG